MGFKWYLGFKWCLLKKTNRQKKWDLKGNWGLNGRDLNGIPIYLIPIEKKHIQPVLSSLLFLYIIYDYI